MRERRRPRPGWPLRGPEVAARRVRRQAVTRTKSFRPSSSTRALGPAPVLAGLHVHVGVASPEACMEALEASPAVAPARAGRSANSPYVAGRETGLASARAEILALLPRAGAPPRRSLVRRAGRCSRGGSSSSVSPTTTRASGGTSVHTRLRDLEVRIADQPDAMEVSAAVAGLVHALVRSTGAGPAADRGVYAREPLGCFPLRSPARLIHPDGDASRRQSPRAARREPRGRLGAAAVDPVRELDQAGEQLAARAAQRASCHCAGGSLPSRSIKAWPFVRRRSR